MARSDDVTLVDVMQAVSEEAANTQEILATVVHLLSSGQVRLSDEAINAMNALRPPRLRPRKMAHLAPGLREFCGKRPPPLS